ncbi:MAG: hypothetical protein K2G09_09035 [Paramuribaculum sp.]|nr:hypothetical protein [Paramuribaculum sp.]
MNYERKARLISICVTVAVIVAVVLLLLFLYLKHTVDEPRVWPPEDTSELLLEGEYVKYGDVYQPDVDELEAAAEEAPADEVVSMPEPVAATNPAPEPVAEEAPLITSKIESAIKVKEQPKPQRTGLTKEELARIEKEKREKEASDRINKRVTFSKPTSGSSVAHGQSGVPTGNSNTGAIYGQPGADLKGRTLASWSHPKSSAIGSIKINIRVNRKGEVIAAEYQNGFGPAASIQETRESCIRAARKSKFSVDEDAPAEQPGSIIYTFE